MRSAKAPVMSAGVITAKLIWNIMNTVSGMVAARRGRMPASRPARKKRERPPTKLVPGVKARL